MTKNEILKKWGFCTYKQALFGNETSGLNEKAYDGPKVFKILRDFFSVKKSNNIMFCYGNDIYYDEDPEVRDICKFFQKYFGIHSLFNNPDCYDDFDGNSHFLRLDDECIIAVKLNEEYFTIYEDFSEPNLQLKFYENENTGIKFVIEYGSDGDWGIIFLFDINMMKLINKFYKEGLEYNKDDVPILYIEEGWKTE